MLSEGPWRIVATPGIHSVPVVGLRFEYHGPKDSEARAVAYSCDTEFSEDIVDLSASADILVHDATNSPRNHSSAADAATVGMRARCGRVLLVHMPPKASLSDRDIGKARGIFANLDRGEEGGSYRW